MKSFGIFGGTFNPPHIAHAIAAESVREQLGFDKIIFIPSANPPLKESIASSHRLEMAKLAFADNENFIVSEIEFKNIEAKSYTVNTLAELKKIYDNVRFGLIIGVDQLIDLPKWKDPERLFQLAEVIVMNRPGYSIESANNIYTGKIKQVDIPFLEISSTIIRNRVKEGMSVRYYVDDKVEEYIIRHNLYK